MRPTIPGIFGARIQGDELMEIGKLLLLVSLAAFVSSFVIAAMLRSGWVGSLDLPNHRSLHSRPVPRSGGIGMLAGVAVGGMVALPPIPWMLALMLLASISLIDDRRSLPAAIRFAFHVLAAVMIVWTYYASSVMGGMVALVAVLAVIWMINLFNFMDGANGLAGGMALFGFGGYAITATLAGNAELAVWAWCIAGAAAGFLVFNFDPAKIFMGDVGSVPLGFLAATLGLEGIVRGIWPVWFPFLVFSPFIVDASVTLMRRVLRGEKVWQAHREHYYQRLVRAGWGHRKLAVRAYLLMLLAAASACALVTLPLPLQWTIMVVWGFGYAGILWAVDRHLNRLSTQNFQTKPNLL